MDFYGGPMNKLFRLVPIAAAIATLTACGGSSSNEAPKFNIPSNTITLAEDGSFSQIYTATDKENDNISYSLSSAATNGAVTIDANTGALIYTPNSDFNGQDSFIIAAADEGGRTTQVFTVEVTAVNDIPVIDGDSVIFSGVETKKGMLSATDIDGDTLTYSIETEPKNGTLTVDSASGELTYIVTKLDQSSDSFVIGVTDSNSDKVMKEIAIRTSLASNDDRAYYYYSSPESHLQQAQTVADSLNNDQVKASVYSSLVSGYANAGFDNKVEQLLDPQEILSKETRVYAIMSAARANVRRGSNELATEYLVQAQNLYNEVLATNGIGTLNYAVFEEIYDLYNAMGDLKGQSQTYSLLDLLMNSLPDGVESQRMFFAYDRAVKDAVAHWQKTGNEEDRLYAKSMAERSIKLIPKIGYATNRNGEQFSSVTLVAYEYLIRELYDLNEIELAKQALATALSLYGYVDYDENHKVAADQYAENTRNEFVWVASGFAAQYIKLYPEADSELLKDIVKGSTWYDFVAGDIVSDAEAARMLAQVSASTTDEQALTLAKAVRNEDDLRKYFTDIISFNKSTNGAINRLIEQGRYSAAKLFIDEALVLVQSDAYLKQNKRDYEFVSGDAGCGRLVNLLTILDARVPDAGYDEDAIATAKVCHNLVTKYYSKEIIDDEGVIISSNLYNVQAAAESARYLALFGLKDELTAILATAEASLAAATDAKDSNRINIFSLLGRHLAEGGELAMGQGYYDRAFTLLLEQEKVADAAYIAYATRYFFSGSRNTSSYQNFLNLIDKSQLLTDNAADIRTTAVDKVTKHLEEMLKLMADVSDIVKNGQYPALAEIFIDVGNYERADKISQDEALGDVEKASIQANIARAKATEDAFPSTPIASVDTDGDGMPNFFAPFATEEMIASSGLVLDTDSDNDGTDDEDDAFPLDASRQ